MQQAHLVWNAALARLRQLVDADSYERYFAEVVPLALNTESATLTLGVSNGLVAFWINDNYSDVMQEALRQVVDVPLEVVFESNHTDALSGKTGSAASAPPPAPRPRSAMPQPSTAESSTHDGEPGDGGPCPWRPDYTFENFVVGDSNKICVAAAQAVCEKPGKAYNPLLIYGGVALGKTHLLQAIANSIASRRKRVKIKYITSEEFVNQYVDAIQTKKLTAFRRSFRNLDVLLIDDIQFFEGKVGSQEEFFHTFNTLHNAHKQMVLASDRMPTEIAGLEQRLVSRFDWGLSAEMMSPDLETRVAILKKKQEKHAIKLTDDILFMVAEKVKSNIRNLESALTRLVMNVSAFQEEMTPQRAEELLRDRFDQERSKTVTIEVIQRKVADYFDISRSDMVSRKRPRKIAHPRMVAMYLCRKLTGESLPSIGDAFNRNHATVIHAVDQVGNLMDKDDELRSAVDLLKRQLET